jgi:hypothetical protein
MDDTPQIGGLPISLAEPDEDTTNQVMQAAGGVPQTEQDSSPILGQLTPPVPGPAPQAPLQLPPRPIGTGVAAQPQQSKADFFRNLLGNFFYSAGQGLAGRGSGPDADARGAGIAINAVHDRDIQRQQMALQQQAIAATTGQKQAQTQALENKSELQDVPLYGPDGKPQTDADGNPVTMKMPAESAAKYLASVGAAAIRGKATQGAATTKADATETVADKNNASKEKIAANKPQTLTDNELYRRANAGNQEAKDILKAKQRDKENIVAMRNSTRPVEVTTRDADGTLVTKYMPASQAMSEGLSSATQGTKNASKIAQIGDIETGSDALRKSIKALGTEKLPPQVIAKLQLAMQSDDPGVVKEQFKAIANEALTPAQQDFVIALNQQNERTLSLRNIAGMGQGASDTRSAIRDLLPGAATGDTKFMLKKLDALDQQVSVLKSGIAKPGGSSAAKGALSIDEAKGYLQRAGGDVNKARALAKKEGRSF